MAEVGESFPMQFALSILQLRQQKQQKDAELSQMRADAADRNFLDKQRLEMAQEAQMQDQLRGGQQMELQRSRLQFDQEQAAADADARRQLESKKIEQERESVAVKAFDDFQKQGTAFLPLSHAKDIGKFTDTFNDETPDGYKVMQIDVPGQGVLLQRVGGPGAQQNLLELQKTEAELEQIKQRRALDFAQTQLVRERAETEQTKRAKLVGGISVRDAEFARSALESYRKVSANALQTAASGGDTARASSLAADWRSYYDKDPKTKKRIEDIETLISSYVGSVNTAGSAPPKTNIDAVKAAGIEDTYHEVIGQALFAPQPKIVGRISTSTQADRARGQAQFELITETGERIPTGPAGENQKLNAPLDPSLVGQAGPDLTPSPDERNLQIKEITRILREWKEKKRPDNDPEVLRARAALSTLSK